MMKILLLGEYSGLYTELSRGLRALGHEVFTASTGDGARNYSADFRWDSKFKNGIGAIDSLTRLYANRHLLTGFDVVQVITPMLLSTWKGLNLRLFKFLKENNKKLFISGAGLAYVGFNYWYDQKESKYYNYVMGPINACREQGKEFHLLAKNRERQIKEELDIMDLVDGYIAIMYEYVEYYKDHPAYLGCLPIPIDVSKYEYRPNIVKDGKVVFFHGKSRPSKGGKYIMGAFDKLKDKYAKYAEFVAEGGLPFDEYVRLLQRTNVVLDDANAYSLGLNSLYSMVQGRVVMGGAEPVADAALGYEYNPALNLKADVDYISNQIEWVLDNKNKLEELGYQSRKLVEDYHECKKVAAKYLELWNLR